MKEGNINISNAYPVSSLKGKSPEKPGKLVTILPEKAVCERRRSRRNKCEHSLELDAI